MVGGHSRLQICLRLKHSEALGWHTLECYRSFLRNLLLCHANARNSFILFILSIVANIEWFKAQMFQTSCTFKGFKSSSSKWVLKAAVAPKPWNDLPPHVKMAPTIQTFKFHLKMYFHLYVFNPGSELVGLCLGFVHFLCVFLMVFFMGLFSWHYFIVFLLKCFAQLWKFCI